MNEKVVKHKAICDELNALYARKNHDYGDSFHQTFVEEGMAMPRIRLGDKFSRFKTLTQTGGQQVTDESIRDTLMDLANYAIMTILEMDEVDTVENKRALTLKEKEDLIAQMHKLRESGQSLYSAAYILGMDDSTARELNREAKIGYEE